MMASYAANVENPGPALGQGLSLDGSALRMRRRSYERLPQEAALFTIGNGFIGIRERAQSRQLHPKRISASSVYLNGVHERRPIEYHEAAYGFARENDLRVPVWDATALGLVVNGETIPSTNWQMVQYTCELCYSTGILLKRLTFARGSAEAIFIEIECLASLVRPSTVTSKISLSSEGFSGSIAVQALINQPFEETLAAHEVVESKIYDPRIGPAISENPWNLESTAHEGNTWALVYRTQRSRIGAATIDLMVTAPESEPCTPVRPAEGVFGQVLQLRLTPETPIHLYRLSSYETDRGQPAPDLLNRCQEHLQAAKGLGHNALKEEHLKHAQRLSIGAFVFLPENPTVENSINFNVMHLAMATGRDAESSLAARGQTGDGYEGHVFWDAEIFALPFFTYTQPEIARSMLEFRHSTLEHAWEIARTMGHPKGALYPWRTISGIECSSYFLAGTAQYHINADIAYAIQQYVEATDDAEFLIGPGIELLIETARVWPQAGFFNARKAGAFCLNRVTGPDEYSALVDNNLYTNIMAKGHLEYALKTLASISSENPMAHRAITKRLMITPDELALWKQIAERMYLPFNADSGIYLQDEHFLDKETWDFENTPADKYPLLLHFHPLTIYRYQVCKQADVVLAMFLRGNDFPAQHKTATLNYYEQITTHDSALSLGTFAILAAESDQLEKAYEYLCRTTFIDIQNLYKNSDQGLHMAALANSWSALVFGFAGMRTHDGNLRFNPRFFPPLGPYSFLIRFRGRLIRIMVTAEQTEYELLEGEPIEICHHGARQSLNSRLSIAKGRTSPIA